MARKSVKRGEIMELGVPSKKAGPADHEDAANLAI
jgi:hypothetical protein